MQNPVWQVQAITQSGPSSGVGGGSMGSPEHVPEHTYIAVASPTDNGFIAEATEYHTIYGLNPVTVNSIEHLVELLAGSTSSLSRIRIVSHVFFPDPGDPPAPTNMNLVFFTGQPRGRGFPQAWFYKFGISDEEGLDALFQSLLEANHNLMSPLFSVPINTNGGVESLDRAVILALRNKFNSSTTPTASALLSPFGLTGSTAQPTGDLRTLVQLITDLFAINEFSDIHLRDDATTPVDHPLSASQITILRNFINNRITELQQSLETPTRTIAHMQDLQQEITSLALSDFPVGLGAFPDFTIYTNVEQHFFQNHDDFRSNLAIVKNRFSSDSVIDIRGCRVAADPGLEYLHALKEFFGNSGDEPTVTGPEWFQSFSTLGFIDRSSEGQIDSIYNSGNSGLSRDDVRSEYETWSERIGIPTHLTFYTDLCAGSAMDFINMSWKSELPQLNMDAIQYNGFGALSFSDTINRLAAIFSIPTNQRPSNTELTNMNTVFQIESITTFPAPADMITQLTDIATALSVTVSNMPTEATLNTSTFQSVISQLKTGISTHAKITGFKSAIGQKLTAATAGIRYMLMIGIPLMVQDSTAGQATNVRLIYYTPLEEDSLRSFMKATWAASPPLPNGIIANDTSIPFNSAHARQVATLTPDRANSQFVVNPSFEYANHIKSVS